MSTPHNVEYEAAKFLQKLIHESTDEPAKLATKLYVILQHMKASGKENSMPYQVISRAMETVINQHSLDIEALMSSRVPSSGGPSGEFARAHAAGCSQTVDVTDSKSVIGDIDSTRTDAFGSVRPPAAPSSFGQEPLQGSVSQRSGRSFDHESPSSMDTRSTNSHSHDRRESASWDQQGNQKDPKRPSTKRKRSDSSAMEPPHDSIQHLDPHTAVPDSRKERLPGKAEITGSFPGGSESWKQGFKGVTSFREAAVPGNVLPPNYGDISGVDYKLASRLDTSGSQMSADGLLQTGNPTNLIETGPLRSSVSSDAGKAPAIPTSAADMPFKEHHLKQLRAQCLVFLAFRNGLAPKRLHLEIALGNILPKEGTSGLVEGAQNDISDKGKLVAASESIYAAEVAVNLMNERSHLGTAAGGFPESDAFSSITENVKTVGQRMGILADSERRCFPPGRGLLEAETHFQEKASSSTLLTSTVQPDLSSVRNPAAESYEDNLPDGANQGVSVMGMKNQLKPDMVRWSGIAHNDYSQGAMASSIQPNLGNGKDGSAALAQREGDIPNFQHAASASWKPIQGIEDDNGTLDRTRSCTDGSNIVPALVTPVVPMEKSSELREEVNLISTGVAPSPKYTLSEKWITAHQKRKIVNDQKWVQKLQKADQRIVTCSNELKETVSSSEDTSAKTRSIIELKKLQLLELQRRLRRNIMNDFFKPVQTEMDRLKSIKKHRIGRRMKHVEKYEQKMKEERQKRIRERQKEFFSEIEVHKERLEDVFKFKRERCKGFNRYVKEFHKRKERIHREKIDRIQREKINLLKINDVEGYLRMVQDAKSDRVKQLLKETEKYLQKLGSRLQEAKTSARQAEMDENRIAASDESCEIVTETEDENDQAKHYKESNEKYYMIAHSIKETVTEQPSGLVGGKLREYQMNGLRWLVSLYNNHLNGILADEMGLGKTVQVISLLCYLMETKNDRGPFLVVVPSSVLPGWEQEMSFWAPGINKIVYAGPPEERRKLFKEKIVHQKFNVLLTTYEYLMNKHDRPKLSKVHWHYVIIDEGHRIKNASCKLNADLKHYRSSHRLLLTGTPLQNSLEELWALLNFLLPNIFNSSEDFSQWFNKPFESNGDTSADEALLSEEENLLIINRLHQVLRPFVLRRLKHKVENELPEKIERLVRCEASAYQKLLMKRVEENLGALGVSKGRAVHNTVMELRNICNHPYLSQLHSDEVDNFIPKHYLPPIIRLCGKLEMLDRLLPKLKATNHRVLFFSTMTRLLDIMEEYLLWKQYRYLRLDGHTSGQDRGALIDKFNQPGSPFFIFLLSIRAGGVGVNLQAADTVIIFDTDWNPQVDLQAQARAHRIGQKKDVLVLRLETVHSVEEQVRAAAEHKLGVANQSITAGFFDNNTSAEDRREYLESLLRENKKEEAAPVLDDDSLNDLLARSESEIDVFEAVDQKRREEEMAVWNRMAKEHSGVGSESSPPPLSRLVTDDDLKAFYEAMKLHEVPSDEHTSSSGIKRKGASLGGFDTQHYGRGKRAREVRSYEEQWTEEEFEKMCQTESPEFLKPKGEKVDTSLPSESVPNSGREDIVLQNLQSDPPVPLSTPLPPPPHPTTTTSTASTPPTSPPSLDSSSFVKKDTTPQVRRGRGRPKRSPVEVSASLGSLSQDPIGVSRSEIQPQKSAVDITTATGVHSLANSSAAEDGSRGTHINKASSLTPAIHDTPSSHDPIPVLSQPKKLGRKGQTAAKSMQEQSGTENTRRRGRKPSRALPLSPTESPVLPPKLCEKLNQQSPALSVSVDASSNVNEDSLAADGSGSLLPKLSGGSDMLAAEDSKALELAVNKASNNVSLTVATSRESGTSRSNAKSRSQNLVGKSPTILPDKTEKPYSIEESNKQALLDYSAFGSAPPDPLDLNNIDSVSHGKLVSVSKSSVDAVTLPVHGSIPPSKGEAETQQPTVSNIGSAQPSAGVRPGRRQSQKPPSGNEPIRRRGRKRGQTVSVDPTPPAIQDKSLCGPVNNQGSMDSSAFTYVAPAAVATNMGMSSHVTVPVTPVIPVSGFVPGSGAVTDVSGSLRQVTVKISPSDLTASQPTSLLPGGTGVPPDSSITPIPVQVLGEDRKDRGRETTPRRRGRKKTSLTPGAPEHSLEQYTFSGQPDGKAGDFMDRKVIGTRSRQISMSQGKSTLAKGHSAGAFVSLSNKDIKVVESPSFPSGVPPSCIGNSSSVKVVGTSKASHPGHTSGISEANLIPKPADFPPISSKGRTNVIVLALDATARHAHPIGTGGKTMINTDSERLNDSTLSAPILKPTGSGPDLALASGADAATLDEDMSAPPGFETPRQCVSNSAFRILEKSNDGGVSKHSDVKTPSVVLALESVSLTTDPGVGRKNKSAVEETSDISLVTKSVSLTVPETSAPVFESASNTAVSSQRDEDMSGPPGFDQPQHSQSERAITKILVCDGDRPSETLVDSAVSFREEQSLRGAGDVVQESDVPAVGDNVASIPVVASDMSAASTSQLTDKNRSFGSSDGDAKDGDFDGPTAVSNPSEALTLELKEEREGAGPTHTEQDTNDDPLAVNIVDCHTTAALSEEPREETEPHSVGAENSHASETVISEAEEERKCAVLSNAEGDINGDSTAVSVVDCHSTAALALELKEETEPPGPSDVKNVINACITSSEDTLNVTASAMESEGLNVCHGPANNNVEDDTAVPTSFVLKHSESGTASCQELIVEVVSHGAGAGVEELDVSAAGSGKSYGEDGNFDGLTTVNSINSHAAEALTLETKEEAECAGRTYTEQDTNYDPIAVSVVNCHNTALTQEPKEDTEPHAVGAENSQAAETLVSESEEEKKSAGLSNAEDNTNDNPTALSTVDCHRTPALTLESKAGIEPHGLSEVENVADVFIAPSEDPLNVTTSTLESEGLEECHGSSDSNAEDSKFDGPTSVNPVNSHAAEAFTLESKQERECAGPRHAEQDTNYDPIAVSIIDCHATATLTQEPQQETEPCGQSHVKNVIDAYIDSSEECHAVSAENSHAESLVSESKEERNCAGLSKAEEDANDDPTAVSILDHPATPASTLQSKAETEPHGPSDVENVIDACIPSPEDTLNVTASAMESEGLEECHAGSAENSHAVETLSVESEEEEKCSGPSNAEGDANDDPTPASEVDCHSTAAVTLESKEVRPAVTLESKEERPAVTLESKEERPAVTLESEEERPAVTLESEEERPAVKLESEEERPAVTLESEEERPAVTLESEEERPAVTLESEEERPAVTLESEEERPAVTLESEEEGPAVTLESEEERPAVTLESEEERPAVTLESEEERPAVTLESEEERPAVTLESEEERPAVTLESEEGPAVTLESEEERPAVTLESEEERPAVKLESEEERPAVTLESEEERPAVTLESKEERPAVTKESEEERIAVTTESKEERPAVTLESEEEREPRRAS